MVRNTQTLVAPPLSPRLAALNSYCILDTPPEKDFDDIVEIAAKICRAPIALITLVDEDRQWFKAKIGIAATQTPLCISFCAHAILQKTTMIVPDAREDARFAGNPLVMGEPFIRFYAGAPLVTPDGYILGTLCVVDYAPRNISADEIDTLEALARQVVTQLELRRSIAQRDVYQIALAESERFACATVDALSAQIAILDESGTIIATNNSWRRFLTENRASQNACGVGANYLTVCDQARGAKSREAAVMAGGIRAIIARTQDEFSLNYHCHSPTEKRWFVARVSRFSGPGPVRIVVAHENVTDRRKAELRLRHQSNHDALTGLPNRLLFKKRLEFALARAQRDSHHFFAVLFIDLDRFKNINDSLGHSVGDKLLIEIADSLQKSLRTTDGVFSAVGSVARMGGDEFMVLLDGLKRPTDAYTVAKRILQQIAVIRTIDGHEVFTTASIGIAPGDQNAAVEDLIRDADAAMYHAKTTGKARFSLFDRSMHEAATKRLQLENDLRHAVNRKQLTLAYQPIVSLRTGQLAGFEALARWNQPDHGPVSPAEFIPLAEETGLILPLGRWALETACTQLAAWQKIARADRPLTMNVNVSRRQLADGHFPAFVAQTIARTGIDPQTLNLEITESIVMENPDAASLLNEIKRTGVRVHLDDFGTGYSSLSCLHRFPLDGLKIDRSFISNATQLRDHAAVIQAVISLARNLGIEVVAEGLETLEQIALLQSFECDKGQGYFFSKPLAAAAAQQFILQCPAVSAA